MDSGGTMTIARRLQIDLDETPYYHCVARCVRRAFLCGDDKPSGRNFDHRKLWILERLKLLAAIFAIDVCAYAILSNHLHLVLRILAEQATKWTDEEVLRRAGQLCPSTVKGIEDWPETRRKQLVVTWRERLSSISWFMGRLCEFIARQANQEDECTGRFWEGRFRCQALLDEGALLACMSYVDLNPVRAGLARGLEDSTWTSIHQRLREVGVGLGEEEGEPEAACAEPAEAQPYPELHSCPRLSPLDGSLEGPANALPIDLFQYVEILRVDRTNGARGQGGADYLSPIPAAPAVRPRSRQLVGIGRTVWLLWLLCGPSRSAEEDGASGGPQVAQGPEAGPVDLRPGSVGAGRTPKSEAKTAGWQPVGFTECRGEPQRPLVLAFHPRGCVTLSSCHPQALIGNRYPPGRTVRYK